MLRGFSAPYLRNPLLRDSLALKIELRTLLMDAWLLRQLQPVTEVFKSSPDKHDLAQASDLPLPQSGLTPNKKECSIFVRYWLAESRESEFRDAESRGEPYKVGGAQL